MNWMKYMECTVYYMNNTVVDRKSKGGCFQKIVNFDNFDVNWIVWQQCERICEYSNINRLNQKQKISKVSYKTQRITIDQMIIIT